MCADAARAHKRVDTCGFHPLVYLPFPLEGLAQGGLLCRRGMTVPRRSKRVMIDSTYEDKLYQTSKFVGAVQYNVPRICAARSCRALR